MPTKRPQVALMGAKFALDSAAGRYKISKIYRGQNEEDLYRSPLTEVGCEREMREITFLRLTGKS